MKQQKKMNLTKREMNMFRFFAVTWILGVIVMISADGNWPSLAVGVVFTVASTIGIRVLYVRDLKRKKPTKSDE